MAVVALVAAAGSGERLGRGEPKAFVPCGGRPLLEWSLDVLSGACDRVVVAVPPGYEHGRDRVSGAASRSASVRDALLAAPEAEIVVVHDAARPLVTRELVERCVAAVRDGWEGAVAAVRVTDTIKQAAPGGRVVRTLERASLWSIQTPQAFRAEALRRALDVPDAVLSAATDDASLVEAAGGAVRVIEASPENIKVTSSLDLGLAQTLLRARRGEGPPC